MKNALSIDVEEHFQVAAFDDVVDRASWDSRRSRVEGNTSRLLDILADQDVQATFFVLGWVAERQAALIRKIHAAGHEIACHGYSHTRIYQQSPDTFRQETRRAKALLEDIVGEAIAGYRAASFSITAKCLWALDILIDSGFEYDSSIAPVWHDNYGIPGAEVRPSLVTAPSGASIAELPMSTLKVFGLRLPAPGGGYFRLYPYWFTRRLIRSINRDGRAVNLYLHPWEIDAEQERFTAAGWKSRIRHYNNLDKVDRRLNSVLTEFEFGTCKDVLLDEGLLQGRVAVRKVS